LSKGGILKDLAELEEDLDRIFKRSCLADDDDEPPIPKEVWALEDAVRGILAYLKEMQNHK
jgi:hypothetical protein